MPDRAARCAALLAESFPEGGSWSAAEIEAVLARDGGYLFENEGGFLIVSAVLDEAEIWTIAVHPDRRRQGYARDLIRQAVEKIAQDGVVRLFLEVAEENEAARALYVSLGFTEEGRRKGYYRRATGDRMDAVLMTLQLGPDPASAFNHRQHKQNSY